MKIRILSLLFLLLSFGGLRAQSLSVEQRRLMSDITTYLKTRNVLLQTYQSTPTDLFYSEGGINYALSLQPDERDPMYLALSTTYQLPESYDPIVLRMVAERLNANKCVKCMTHDQQIVFLAEWYLLDYGAFRYSYARIHEQMTLMAQQFSPLYAELCGNVQAGNGINVGIPGQNAVGLLPRQEDAAGGSGLPSQPALTASSDPVTEEVLLSRPGYSERGKRRLELNYVKLKSDCTILELVSYSDDDGMTYKWCSVNPNAYIEVDGTRYTLKGREGIAASPLTTYYSSSGRLTFRLIFPPIPAATRQFDFVNDPDKQWYLRGVRLKRDR